MAESKWGRKETIIWPPHKPIYTFSAVFLASILTGLFVSMHFAFVLTPLQQFDLPIYKRPPSWRVFASPANINYR